MSSEDETTLFPHVSERRPNKLDVVPRAGIILDNKLNLECCLVSPRRCYHVVIYDRFSLVSSCRL